MDSFSGGIAAAQLVGLLSGVATATQKFYNDYKGAISSYPTLMRQVENTEKVATKSLISPSK